MGRHYLATRKPQRIERIRRRVEHMHKRGVPVSRMNYKWGGHDVALDTLLGQIESLGYTALCNIENLLEAIDADYTRAMAEARTGIAYLAGRNRISVKEVVSMASEICPPASDNEYEVRGINPEKVVAEQTKYGLSPFFLLRHPIRGSGLFYEWGFLSELSLAQLELLTLQLQAKTGRDPAPVLPFWKNEPVKN